MPVSKKLSEDRADIDALKAAVDLAALAESLGLKLEPRGRNLVAHCPSHEDKTPSLTVNPDMQLWRCFSCRQGGDVISLLQTVEGLSFRQAVERLKSLTGTLPAPPPRSEQPPAAEADQAHQDRFGEGMSRPQLLGRVAEFYRQRLAESREARAYLASRSLAVPEMLDAFKVGFADGYSLLRTFGADGPQRDALMSLGVITPQGRELMAGCIVIPLEHPDLGVVGLYGRKVAPHARVHHLYLPGPKRGVLNWQALKASPKVVLTESVLDALSLWVAGVRHVSCLYGAEGMPRDLNELLGRFAVQEVHACLDADTAGQQATLRLAGDLARKGIRCLNIALPAGKDPNQMLCELGTDGLAEYLHDAVPAEVHQQVPVAPAEIEPTGDGFIARFGEATYRVIPRPPFNGKLKVTLRPQLADKAFVDSIDLYSHHNRARFAQHVSRELQLMREEVDQHLLSILEAAERWVADTTESSQELGESRTPPPMSQAERDEAMAFLQRPDLMRAILSDIESLGVVGEENGKLLAYLIGVSRKLAKPLSGIILSQSGAGKSTLAEIVEELTPPEDVCSYSRVSAQALGYLPKDFLKRKLLILEENVGAQAAEYSIRVLQSKQKLTQAVPVKDPMTGKITTKCFEVEGPIAYLETTTNSNLNYENTTRCFELVMDESEEQTQRIQRRQRLAYTPRGLEHTTSSEAIKRKHHNAQRLLEPVPVIIPYVHLLSFPSRWLRTRRDHQRFLCLIEAVAFLHQHSRPRGALRSGEGAITHIEATLEDYRLAYSLACDVLGITLHELSRGAQELWELAQEMVDATGKKREAVYFTRRELRGHTGWQDHRLRSALAELVEMEYALALGGSQGKTFSYRLATAGGDAGFSLTSLTTPDELATMLAADAAR